MADNKVLIELQLIQKGDQISMVQKNTEKLSKSTDKASKSTKNLKKQQDAQYTRQKQGVIQTANGTKNFSKMQQSIDGGGGGGAGGLVRAYALLAANVFALTAAFGILSRAAGVETLTKSMIQLEVVSGNSIRGVARDLQEASGFGMDFAESMRAVSLATSAGFAGPQIEALGKVARSAAVSLGRNIPDALDRIFRGVIKVEPELLDEIGLFVRVNEASAKYAAQLGVAVGDLTEFQKRQAFLNEALDQGTTKFQAFDDIEIDAFAKLATVFSDMTQAVMSGFLPALEGVINFLAENKLLFGTAFSAIVFVLLKMAVPAMGLFTQSMAANAVAAQKMTIQQVKRSKHMASIARQSHIAQMKDVKEKLVAEAALAQAKSQAGPQGKLSVRGKDASKRLEVALNKENLSVKAREEIVTQRIADLEKKQGFQQRMQNEDNKEELRLLQEELAIITQINSQEASTAALKTQQGMSGASALAINRAKIASLKAEALATVVATAETEGFSMAMRRAIFLSQQLGKDISVLGGRFIALQKGIFVAKAGMVSLGVAAQAMWMRIMGPLSIILLFLPALIALGKHLGLGSQAADDLATATTSAEEALELMPKRILHVEQALAKLNVTSKESNMAFEAFNKGVGSTATALIEQGKAFEEYMKLARPFAVFWEETVPSFFGMGTANAINDGTSNLIREYKKALDNNGELLSPKMKQALDRLENSRRMVAEERSPMKRILNTILGGPVAMLAGKSGKTTGRMIKDGGSQEAKDAIIALSDKEITDINNLRAAIDGARDSARSFANSLIVSTDIDKSLATFRQITTTVRETEMSEGRRRTYLNEIGRDSAFQALMREEERVFMKDRSKSNEERLSMLDQIEKRLFLQQESLLRIKVLTAEIAHTQKILRTATSQSVGAVDELIQSESKLRKIKMDELNFTIQNKASATGLTEAELIALSQKDSLVEDIAESEAALAHLKKYNFDMDNLSLYNQKAIALTGENLVAVQAAIVAIRERGLQQLKDQIAIQTQEERMSVMKAKIEIQNLKTQEKRNALARDGAKLENQLVRGSGKANTFQQAKELINDEKSQLLTRQLMVDQEKNLVIAQMGVQAETMRVMSERAGISAEDKKMYEQAAQDFRDAGADMAANLQTGADQAAVRFLTKLLEKTSKGSGFADATFASITQGQTDRAVFDEAKAGTVGKDGTFGDQATKDAALQNLAINSVEQTLLSFAASLTEAFGEEGALVAAMATVTANILDIGQNFGTVFGQAEGGLEKTAVIAGTAAAVIGQIGALTQAQAKADMAAIDNLIKAERNRDGKSKESLAKISGMEKKKEAIKRKAFEDNKKMMLAQAVMSTAMGVAQALSGPPGLPWTIPFGILMASMGAKQISIIKGMTYDGGDKNASKPQSISIGKRNNSVDVGRGVTGGELSYLRGASGIGSNANNFTPGGAAGMRKGYSTGGEIMVGERGPETVSPTALGYEVTPNDKIGGTNLNANITINAVDAAGVENVLMNQRGNIISMIQEAAHEHGEEFIESVNPQTYAGGDG